MLGTFSFEPYFKSYCYFTVRSLEILEIAFRSLSPSSSLLPLFSAPPLCSAVAGAVESQPGPLLLRASANASRCSSSTALCLVLEPPLQCHAAQSSPPVATSPSPWPGQGRGHRPPLARARALQIPQLSIPFALSLAPCSHTTERAAAPPRTLASSSHRRAHTSALPCPQLTPSIAPPHPRTAHGQLRLAQNSPEPLAVVARAPPPPARSGTRSSAPPPPALTPPLGPPRPCTAGRPPSLAQSSPERRLRHLPPPPTRLLRRAAASEPLPAPKTTLRCALNP